MYGLRVFLWCSGLCDYIGHPQPPDRSQHGCTVRVNRDPPVCGSLVGNRFLVMFLGHLHQKIEGGSFRTFWRALEMRLLTGKDKTLSIVVDKRPRNLTPTVHSKPLFSSTPPYTFVTSSPVAVGPLFSLLFIKIFHLFVFTQSVVLSSHHLRNVVPWFVKGLRWFDELFARPRAAPRVEGVVSRASFFAASSWIPPCCVLCNCSVRRRERWLIAEPVPRRSAHSALFGFPRSCTGLLWFFGFTSPSASSDQSEYGCDRGLVFQLRSPGLAPAEALVRLSATVAAACLFFGCVPRGQRVLLDADNARIDRPVNMSGGACFCWSLVLLLPVAARECPLREALWKVFCSRAASPAPDALVTKSRLLA